jgi:hypothetical protein
MRSFSRLLLLALAAVVSTISACGKGDSPPNGADRATAAPSALAPKAAPPPDAPPSAVDVLVADEATWQTLVKDGPADAFCSKASAVAADLAEVPDPSDADAHEALRRARVGIKKVNHDNCGDADWRMTWAFMVHVALAPAAQLRPLPYQVPPELQKDVGDLLSGSHGPPAASPEAAVRLITSDVDAACACKDEACFDAGRDRFLNDALANERLHFTDEQGAQAQELARHLKECDARITHRAP